MDALTGVLNRRALESRAIELAHQAANTGEPVALLLGDLDGFKTVNDTYGHAAGDDALREIAKRLRKHLRAFEGVYRFGGEEFAVLLAGASLDDAAAAAERLRTAVAANPIGELTLSMSFGVAGTAPGAPFAFDAVFADADRALYEAKRGGRNRVCAAAPTGAVARRPVLASAV
jgi:diguanylate cyclase (GGDEF)-like protein